MTRINQEEYEVLKELDDKWKWIARDKDGVLGAYDAKVVKTKFHNFWIMAIKKKIDLTLFNFIQWEDEEPYNISELIEEYERESHIKQVLEFYEEGFRNVREAFIKLSKAFSEESEETEMKKDIEWAKKKIKEIHTLTFDSYEAAVIANNKHFQMKNSEQLALINKIMEILDQLDEPEQPKITLQDVTDKLWKLPLNNRKLWLARLNDEFQEGYIVPLGLKTTDGEEQYLTYNGSYFASRRNRYLQQTFATLEEIPEFYRDLAERVL